MRRLLWGAALVLVCAGAALAGDWRVLWRRMPEAKKNALLRAWRKWRAMPETERARLMKRWRALKAMSEGERRRLLQRARRWRRLSEEQRRRIMSKWKRWQRLRGQLVMALPEEQRRELLRMPGPRRARELRRLLHRHALDVYRALLDCMPRKQMMSLLQLPQGEFLTRMKELLKRREKVIYDALLQTLPAAERSRLAGLDERRRRVELRRLVRKRMRWRGAALRALGYGARLRRLSHVPPTLAAIEGERMWRSALMENAGRLGDCLARVGPSRREKIVSALKAGRAPEGLDVPKEVGRLMRLPAEARDEILRVKCRLRRPPLEPPRGPRHKNRRPPQPRSS